MADRVGVWIIGAYGDVAMTAMVGARAIARGLAAPTGMVTDLVELKGRRIDTKNTHGSGCAFSAAIAAGLAKGQQPLEAVRAAKDFIGGAIEHSLEIGKGHGPVNPTFRD